MKLLLAKAKNQVLISEGKDPEPLPETEPLRKPDLSVFDTEEEIRRDDAIIEAYISDNPDERRLSNARGHSQAELLKYWHSSPEGLKWHKDFERAWRPKLIEIHNKYL